MDGIRARLSSKRGRKEVFDGFELTATTIFSAEFAKRFYDWLSFPEQTIEQRGVTYKRCRLSHLRRFVEEAGEKSETIPQSNLVLV